MTPAKPSMLLVFVFVVLLVLLSLVMAAVTQAETVVRITTETGRDETFRGVRYLIIQDTDGTVLNVYPVDDEPNEFNHPVPGYTVQGWSGMWAVEVGEDEDGEDWP